MTRLEYVSHERRTACNVCCEPRIGGIVARAVTSYARAADRFTDAESPASFSSAQVVVAFAPKLSSGLDIPPNAYFVLIQWLRYTA